MLVKQKLTNIAIKLGQKDEGMWIVKSYFRWIYMCGLTSSCSNYVSGVKIPVSIRLSLPDADGNPQTGEWLYRRRQEMHTQLILLAGDHAHVNQPVLLWFHSLSG